MKRKYLGPVIVLLLVMLFSPYLLMAGWHLVSRGRVVCSGAIVPVPFGWMPVPESWRNTPSPQLMRMPVTLISGTAQGHISIAVEQRKFATDSDSLRSWVHSVESLYRPKGYTVQGPIAIGTRGDSYCITLRAEAGVESSAVCYLKDGKWYASFDGKVGDLDTFLQTVSNLE